MASEELKGEEEGKWFKRKAFSKADPTGPLSNTDPKTQRFSLDTVKNLRCTSMKWAALPSSIQRRWVGVGADEWEMTFLNS